MGEYVNPSNREFWITRKSEIFVDKSMLIPYINRCMDTMNRFVCVSRPRRFGKSTDAQMLAAYYSRGCDSAALFDDLKVSKAGPDPYRNQCHVIFLNMQAFLSNSKNAEQLIVYLQEELLEELAVEIQKWKPDYTIKQFRPLQKAIACLAQESGIPILFIVDEWDCIFREYKSDTDAQRSYLDFLRDLFKDNASVSLVYMTGILPIKKYGTHSAINIFDEYSMIDASPLAPFMGFTKEEVQKLCSQYGKDFEQMCRWYDGYHLEHDISIYSPRSVVSSVLRGHYGCYWSQTETYEALRVYIDMNYDGLRDRIIRLLAGDKVPVETGAFENDMSTFQSADDVLTLLVHLGYLGYHKEQKTVCIPNKEVRDIFVQSVKNSGWSETYEALKNSQELLEATWRMEEKKVAEYVEKAHIETSILQYHDENALAYTISLAYITARNHYRIIREFPSGKGFADLVFLPYGEKPAMIVELKWNKSADTAIRQIKEKGYVQGLERYLDDLLLVGISYQKKNKRHECRIEKYKG